MSDIFISYNSADRDWVSKLAKLLVKEDYTVFWDRKIPIGQQWDTFIFERLEQSKCIIVVWSNQSVASDWVRREASHAREHKKILPVLMEQVAPPFGFGDFQSADLTGSALTPKTTEVAEFLEAVEQKVGRKQAGTLQRTEPRPDLQTLLLDVGAELVSTVREKENEILEYPLVKKLTDGAKSAGAMIDRFGESDGITSKITRAALAPHKGRTRPPKAG